MKYLRSVIFWSHLISGIIAGAIIFIMSATGFVLMYEHEWVDFAERDVRNVVPPAQAQTLSIDEIVARVRGQNAGAPPTGIILRNDQTASVAVSFGADGTSYVNPYNGVVLGNESGLHDWLHEVAGWHRWLGMEGSGRAIGRAVTGACNLVFLWLAITGVYLWYPRSWQWRKLKPALLFNFRLRGKARNWNWHHAIGFWSSGVLIILTTTAIFMSYQWAGNLLYTLTGSEPPRRNERPRAAPVQTVKTTGHSSENNSSASMAGMDVMLEHARQRVPGWEMIMLRFSPGGDGQVTASIRSGDAFHAFERSQLTLNRITGDVVRWEPYDSASTGRKLRTWMRALHTGEAFGLAGQTVAGIASLGGCFLVWTGFALTWRRFRCRNRDADSAITTNGAIHTTNKGGNMSTSTLKTESCLMTWFKKIIAGIVRRHRKTTGLTAVFLTLILAHGATLNAQSPPDSNNPETPSSVSDTTGQAGSSEVITVPEVRVKAVQDASGGNVVDGTSLKLPATLHETPRSVTVIDAERIRDQNFRTPVDTLYYTPGVFPNSTASGGYHFIARGFRILPGETLIDGFSGFYVGGGQSPQMLYGVDRVVTLRGPAGLLYGAATLPGGIINIITKKPEEMASTRLDLTAGTYAGNGLAFGNRATTGTEFDSTGPLTSNGRLLYRAIIAGDNSGQYTGSVLNQTRYFSGGLTFKGDLLGRTTFTPLVQFARNKRPAGAAMVISPSTSLSANDGQSGPVNTSDLSPLEVNLYDGSRTDEMLVAGFDFSAMPTDAFTMNVSYRYIGYETDINQWSPQVNSAAQRTQLVSSGAVSRIQAKSEADRYSHNFDLNGLYEFMPAQWWKNLVHAGFNGRQYNSKSRNAAGPLSTPQSPINIYTGGVTTPLADVSTGWQAAALDDDLYWNAYIQNQAAFLDERFVLTLGLGYGQQEYHDEPVRKGDMTPNAAFLFNVSKETAFYASYATSYQPADPALEDYGGNPGGFDPQTGVNYEVGLKYDAPSGRASGALSLFRTRRENVIVQDTSLGATNVNGRPYYLQQDGQSAQGIELSSEYSILSNWRLTGTLAYIDASYESGLFPGPVAKTPELSWSLFTQYNVAGGPLKNLGTGLGIVWQDERMGGNAARTATTPDPLTLPSFYRVDASLSYGFNSNYDIILNVQNLFDETIFVDGTTGANLQVAAPRTLTVRAGYRF